MQLMALGRLDLSEADYMQVIEAKTAKLFEAAGALGAIAAGATRAPSVDVGIQPATRRRLPDRRRRA